MSIQTAGPLSCFGGPIGQSARAGAAIIAAPEASMVRRVNDVRISSMACSPNGRLSSRCDGGMVHGLTVSVQRTASRRSSLKDHNTMARVPYLQQSDLPPEHQDILARPIALNRAMANSPNAAKAMTGLAMYIRHHSKLDPRLRELAILQVGYLARSPYEYSHHVKLGREAGVTDDDIRAINEETAGRPTKLDALSKTVLRAAREITTDL